MDGNATPVSTPITEVSAALEAPTTDPATAPEAEPVVSEDAERAGRLENEPKDIKKQLGEAQKAAEAANRVKKQLERVGKSEAEQLEERRKEIEEDARKYKMLMAGAKAKQVFSGTGLSEDMYSPILELITTEDEAKTESIAQEFKSILELQAKSIEKAVREKILKDTPAPPAGSDKNPVDLFIAAFNE